MKDLIKILENPFSKVEAKNVIEFQEKCFDIAKTLIGKYCIKSGDRYYYFAEIEFYYYDAINWNEKWNEETYARNECKAGKLFFHLSGIDICFNSNLPKDFKKKKQGFGGGILIRSIMEYDKENKVVTVGPLTCVNKMLNDCIDGKMPQIISKQHDCNPKETYRYFGKEDFKLIGTKTENGKTNRDGELKLAYYDTLIEDDVWNRARSNYSDRLHPKTM